MSHNIVYGEICHKYIHMMGWKDQTSKEIVTCGNSVSLSSYCEQTAAGMLRAFPVHFLPLQSNSTQCNVHDSCAATENCMKCDISPQMSHQSEILHSLIFLYWLCLWKTLSQFANSFIKNYLINWSRLISVNSRNLINHWSMNWDQFKVPLCYYCFLGSVVTLWFLKWQVVDPFHCKYFVTQFSGKTQMFHFRFYGFYYMYLIWWMQITSPLL